MSAAWLGKNEDELAFCAGCALLSLGTGGILGSLVEPSSEMKPPNNLPPLLI